MNELREALWESPAPDGSELARERTVAAVVAQLRDAERRSWRNFRMRTATVVGVALTALAVATPQGRDAVTWAAELVGIGEVGGPPTSEQRPSSVVPDSEQIVIGTGRAPDGTPFEIVAYRTDKAVAGEPQDGTTCVFVDFPKGGDRGGGSCGDDILPADGHLQVTQVTDAKAGQGPGSPYVVGYVSPQVENVRLEGDGLPGPAKAHVAFVTRPFRHRIGADREVGGFVAFLPSGLNLSSDAASPIHVVARDEAGHEIGRVSILDRVAPNASTRSSSHGGASGAVTAEDCPEIAQALAEQGRSGTSLDFNGDSCPGLELMRWALENNPDLKGISVADRAP
jgi:hypothetical protein